MNEKSNPMSMMYKTIPAVAELNKVPGFDPLKFLRHKVSRKTNEEMLQLELPYQKLWFRLRHPQGRMKLTTLRITEQLAIMEAIESVQCTGNNGKRCARDTGYLERYTYQNGRYMNWQTAEKEHGERRECLTPY